MFPPPPQIECRFSGYNKQPNIPPFSQLQIACSIRSNISPVSQSVIIHQNKSQHKIFKNKGILLHTVSQLCPGSLRTYQIQSHVTTTCDFQFWKEQHLSDCLTHQTLILNTCYLQTIRLFSFNALFTLLDIISSLILPNVPPPTGSSFMSMGKTTSCFCGGKCPLRNTLTHRLFSPHEQ